jgi:hypothetical protein
MRVDCPGPENKKPATGREYGSSNVGGKAVMVPGQGFGGLCASACGLGYEPSTVRPDEKAQGVNLGLIKFLLRND